jgi:DNA gyrase subunit A
MAEDENNTTQETAQATGIDAVSSAGVPAEPQAQTAGSAAYVPTRWGRIKDEDIVQEMRNSFRDYAMSVIVDRALPDVRDGFKPVHRRVLFSMHELHNTFNNPTKKCARIVGDVIGKYHPHGDQAVYQTLVRLAQDFSMRYPLVFGQGNFGSIDGDGAAAMRYTECRLAQIADMMLEGLDEETVDFQPNFDNSEQEPVVLPARLPNLLLNGSAGIAVGMATSIPPHNLSEVVEACRHLLAHPEAGIDELIERMPAPDFPTGGVIYGVKGVHEGYRTGRGRVIIRSHTHFEELSGGRQAIIVDDVPYQVNKKVLVENIYALVRDKKLEGIHDIRDESSKDVRIVIELKAGAFGEVILNNLFKLTQMQSSFGINMVVIENRQPKLMNLRQMIEAFLRHRREVVNRRTIFRLGKQRMRGHILEGQAVALSNIDEFIAVIKAAPTPQIAKLQLMARGWESALVKGLLAGADPAQYRPAEVDSSCGLRADGLYYLSDIQTEKILQMALQKLTGLEQDKINGDYRDAHAQVTDLLDILAKPERVRRIMDEELLELKTKYGDARRSEIDLSSDPNFNPLDFVPSETAVVTLSREGYVKRQALSEYQQQRRGGTGKRATQMKEGDVIEQLFVANTHDKILCFSNLGRVYRLEVYLIPEGSRNSKGKAIVNLLELQEGEKISVILPVREFDENKFVFMATEQATVKKTSLAEFVNVNRKGKYAITLEEGDSLIGVALTDGSHDVMLFSNQGKAVRFAETDVRSMGRTARGVGGMKLEEGGKLISMLVAEDDSQLVLTACENGYGKCTPVTEYTRHGRNTKGMIAIATSERNGDVVAATLVRPGDSLMLLTAHGHLVRTPVDSVRVVSRAAQGVTLIDVRDDKLVRITRVAEDDADGETPPDESGAGEVPEENRPPQNELAEDAAGQAEPGSDGSDR